MNHHQLANHASLGGLPSGSMDIDMDRDTHLSQPSLPSHQDSTSIFLQNPVAQGSGLLDSQQQQEEQQKHFQQQIPVNFQKSMSQLNNGSVHGGQYPSSANITAVTSTYGISDDDLHQPGSRPTSHHHHEDLTSSSRTSLQPPRTPASTIDEDIDPEDLVCDLCQWKPRGVRENLRGYLRKHKNVHKGLRLACDVPGCKKSFSRLDNLKTHRREKHSIDDTAPASKTTSTVSVDSASIIAGHHIATAGSNSLSVKRTMAMNEYANGGVMMAIPTTVVSTQPQHVLQAAANIAQAQAQARAQVRQAQLQAQAQHQVHVQAQAHAQFVQAQMQAQAAQEQAQQVQPEPPRPGSKRQRESLDHGYRGVTGEHAALWPLMQI
ncbi:hypothetical protein SBRCBS47491_001709 [Sporothrix bragantina]|uniref:C2H2-type domain-containing protein n=1 Tax=Sporothrix bragantina TaxID=671064 RepID=A0ABP0B0X0_9PEZI